MMDMGVWKSKNRLEKTDLVSKSKDILFIRVENLSNLNETIDNNLKKIRRNLQWIVKKTEDSRVNRDENVTNYVAKRLLEDNIFKIIYKTNVIKI